MRGHEGSVSSISVHSSGRYAISTSSDTAQLWDLDTFQRKRKLNIRQSVGIQRVNMQTYQMKTTGQIFISSGGFLTMKTKTPMTMPLLFLVLIERPQGQKLHTVRLTLYVQ